MKSTRFLWISTCLIIIIFAGLPLFLLPADVSALGAILSAAGNFVAVLWFYNSLSQQKEILDVQQKQLNLQQQQFDKHFIIIHSEYIQHCRNYSKDILENALHSVNAHFGVDKSHKYIPIYFQNAISKLQEIVFNESDPKVVFIALEQFLPMLEITRTYLLGFIEATLSLPNIDTKFKHINFLNPHEQIPELFEFIECSQNIPTFILRENGIAYLLASFIKDSVAPYVPLLSECCTLSISQLHESRREEICNSIKQFCKDHPNIDIPIFKKTIKSTA